MYYIYLNTSHVNLNQVLRTLRKIKIYYLNTSHINLNLNPTQISHF
ncbi:hypothetical protein CNEO4_290065 [Clostridium neonatale]|nr:hypothetical protein CNEO_310063 [Clostridium neonatale]CAI3535074.1 hypothetical protein CNEO3_100064 [Clostridium neonatale]CAI3578688.1 hypothetical protein CNEO4_160065 [Clostridium neonatale]CAI3605208.1 hypothetical protein CNEO4_290065 [Clostridium neonatale]